MPSCLSPGSGPARKPTPAREEPARKPALACEDLLAVRGMPWRPGSCLLLLSVPSRTVVPNVREMGGKAWRWRRDIGLSSAI